MNCGDVCPVPMRDIPQLPVEPRPNILLLLLLYTHECAYNHHLLTWETGGVLTESTWNDLTFLKKKGSFFFLLRKKKRINNNKITKTEIRVFFFQGGIFEFLLLLLFFFQIELSISKSIRPFLHKNVDFFFLSTLLRQTERQTDRC
jgi:hypothetical protein